MIPAHVAMVKNIKSVAAEIMDEFSAASTSSFSAIPTHLITGFLGVGKTSAILNLLKTKPTHERWAILVNEFGEIGLDGSLMQGQYTQEQGVYIREVPGGCMCCTTGLPMQVALNQLLRLAKPHRLLIEPTGLGHPKEVVETLRKEDFRSVIDLQKIITLVDARNLSDSRYTDHPIFNQQIAIADIVVGNKQDLYQREDKAKLDFYVKQHGSDGAQVLFAEQSDISAIDLSGKTDAISKTHHHHHHDHDHQIDVNKVLVSDELIPESGFLSASNKGEGFNSVGWRFSENRIFHYDTLFSFLNRLSSERMKAVFITDKGRFSYNLTSDGLIEDKIENCTESRIEIIASTHNKAWESELMKCVAPI